MLIILLFFTLYRFDHLDVFCLIRRKYILIHDFYLFSDMYICVCVFFCLIHLLTIYCFVCIKYVNKMLYLLFCS